MSKTVKESKMQLLYHGRPWYEAMATILKAVNQHPPCSDSMEDESVNAQVATHIVGAEYAKAKKKHPIFPRNPAEGLCIINEELGELAEVINDKGAVERQIEEAAHVAVTAIRFIEQRL